MTRPNFRRMGIACMSLAICTLLLLGVLAAQLGMIPLQAALIVAAFIVGVIGGASMALMVALDVLTEDNGKAG